MLYSDDFILSLPAELSESVVKVIEVLNGKNPRTNDDILEARDLLAAIFLSHGSQLEQLILQTQDSNTVFQQLQGIYNTHFNTLTTERSKTRQESFATLLGRSFHYSLSEADAERIQGLINELRTLISENTQFKEDHRRRLLERLEQLQRELHRRLSNLDRFYGLVGDAGVLLGKFGNDAKPFVDRIREIVEIVWRSQAGAEQLPASAKPALLTSDSPSSAQE